MKRAESRGPSIDMEKCVEEVGHNRFNLVLIASERLREIRRKTSDPSKYASSIDALSDIQDGKVNPTVYLSKIGEGKKNKS